MLVPNFLIIFFFREGIQSCKMIKVEIPNRPKQWDEARVRLDGPFYSWMNGVL